MRSKKAWLLVVPFALIVMTSKARADLLDDEEPSVTKPASTSTSDSTATSTATSSSTSKNKAKPEPVIKEPAPHAKSRAPVANTSIIPPKKPQKPGAKDKHQEKEPVHFASKGLKGLREKGMVELMQDVVVTQGDLKMEANHAQVFFDEANHEVQKVIAEGDVRIHGVDENSGEKFRAFGNQAVFLNKDRIVVLEGNAKLWRGEDSVIRSKKITYEMDSGWIKADRVTGELVPGDKDKK